MLENKGIRGLELDWFRSYLTNRQQFVSLSSEFSNYSAIKLGVPQGSILGPLLFILYIDEIPKVTNLTVYLFADDTVILASDDNIRRLEQTINEEFKKICSYFRSYKLSLNPKKTQYMIFSNSEMVHTENIHVYIDNNNTDENLDKNKFEIQRILAADDNPTYKYLGILVDPHFSFKYHADQISAKLSRALYILRRSKNFLPEKSLLLLYYSLFHCHITYAAEVWTSVSDHLLHQIALKQKTALRIITNARYNAHTQPLFKKLNILPFKELVKYQRLVFFQTIVQKRAPTLFDNIWITNRDYRLNNIQPDNPYRELRDDNEFMIGFSRTKTLQRSPLFNLPLEWNQLPPEIQIIRNVSEFKTKLKKYLMDKIPEIFQCNRLFCPACHT